MDHLLATNDVRIALVRAVESRDWAVEDWIDDATLRRHHKEYVILVDPEGQSHKAAVVPDGYFVLRVREYRSPNFLEVDLGTVVGQAAHWGRRDWARKIRVYTQYYDAGLFERRYRSRSMRVLTVTTTPARLATLKHATEEAGGDSRFWFTTFDALTPDAALTDPIWQVASLPEPQALVRSTPGDP